MAIGKEKAIAIGMKNWKKRFGNWEFESWIQKVQKSIYFFICCQLASMGIDKTSNRLNRYKKYHKEGWKKWGEEKSSQSWSSTQPFIDKGPTFKIIWSESTFPTWKEEKLYVWYRDQNKIFLFGKPFYSVVQIFSSTPINKGRKSQ